MGTLWIWIWRPRKTWRIWWRLEKSSWKNQFRGWIVEPEFMSLLITVGLILRHWKSEFFFLNLFSKFIVVFFVVVVDRFEGHDFVYICRLAKLLSDERKLRLSNSSWRSFTCRKLTGVSVLFSFSFPHSLKKKSIFRLWLVMFDFLTTLFVRKWIIYHFVCDKAADSFVEGIKSFFFFLWISYLTT